MNPTAPIAAALLALSLTACGSTEQPASSPSGETTESRTSPATPPSSAPAKIKPTAASVAKKIEAAIPGLKLTTITEDNDPNDLIGRPTGYVAAVVIKDPRLEDCGTDLGATCGATVEQWPSEAAAKKRSDYIQGLMADSPILGQEYDYIVGPVLVRVAGDLKPSQAKEYEQAVTQ